MSKLGTTAKLPIVGLLAALALAPAPARAQETRGPSESPYPENRLRLYRLQLDWNQIGYVVPEKVFRFGSFIRMHPSGFRGDEYNLYFAPTYGLGKGWEVTAGVTGAERIGPGGEALFFGAGVQKQFVTETLKRPAVSVGAYGMFGPHSHESGTLYLAASKQLLTKGKRALFVHGGAKLESYDGDDYGESTGFRPYVGSTVVLSPRFFVGAEISPAQPWEDDVPFAVRLTYRLYKRIGLSGGVRNNGFETEPFISVAF